MKSIFTKEFWLNVLVAALIGFALLLFVSWGLKVYTRHGQSIAVPNVKDKSLAKAIEILEDNGLEYEILDSSFVENKPPLAVLEMNPKPASKVKKGRIIYLTVNSATKPTVAMPDLVGKSSFKFAKLQLEGFGLTVAEPIYKPDPHVGAVLEILIGGKPAVPGKKVPKGTLVTIVVGDGLMNSATEVPYLIGLTYQQAMDKLATLNMPLGSIIVDDGVKDTLGGFIYKQFPTGDNNSLLRQGEVIDIFIAKEMPEDIKIKEDLYDKKVDTL